MVEAKKIRNMRENSERWGELGQGQGIVIRVAKVGGLNLFLII